jgi:hypothetical protein
MAKKEAKEKTSEKSQSTKKPKTGEPVNEDKKTVKISTGKDGKVVVELKNKPKKEEKTTSDTRTEKKENKTEKKVEVKLKKDKTSSKKETKQSKKPKETKKKAKVWNEHDRPDRIEKATNRKQKTRKPSKGIWGIIKSFIPKFGK